MIKTQRFALEATFVFIVVLLNLKNVLVQGDRISETRCASYRSESRVLTSFNCNNTRAFLSNHELGGADAEPGEFPHQALLGWRTGEAPLEQIEFNCGGSLISPQFVLTAAQCFKFGDPVVVRLGATNLQNKSANEVDFSIEDIIKHPDHKFSSFYHNIALVKLAKPVKFTPYIKPACLGVTPSSDGSESSVIATGYGYEEYGENVNRKLRKVSLDYQQQSECEERYGNLRTLKRGLDDGQICAGSKWDASDSCQTDLGGPIQLVVDSEACIHNIVGLFSVGSLCGAGDSSSIYTRVEKYLDWIESVVWS